MQTQSGQAHFTPGAQQSEMLRYQADLLGHFADRSPSVETRRNQPKPVGLAKTAEPFRVLNSLVLCHAIINI
jgi:hypothetical protein